MARITRTMDSDRRQDLDVVSNALVPALASFGTGATAGGIVTFLYFIARAAGWTPLNPSMVWGSLFTAELNSATWWLGHGIHLLVSGLVGVFYGTAFKAYDRSGPGIGASFGVVHWLISGVLLGFLSVIHPVLGERVAVPGLFAVGYGLLSAMTFLGTHLIYGALVGAFYRAAAVSEAEHHPERRFSRVNSVH